MKILFVSNLFPDADQPIRGLDNARLLNQLARQCEIRVIALRPTPWLWPFAKTPAAQSRPEDKTLKPVYLPCPYIPKVGSRWNHRLMAGSLRLCLQKFWREFPFETVLVSWIYPDGCAVAELAASKPLSFVAIAQGSDAHQYLQMPVRRRIIVAGMNRASAVVARSQELTDRLSAAGVAAARLHTIYNGVDSSLYRPAEKRLARIGLGLSPNDPVILYVGNFLPIKNPLLAIAAHYELCRARVPTARLVMLGDGPLLESARKRADRAHSGARVELMGRQPPGQVARYLQAADVLCVPSHNEGVPNVILEAFACGVPVVATRVGGVPEVLCYEWLGRLVPSGNVSAMTNALAEMLTQCGDQKRIAQYAQQFSWEQTAQKHMSLLLNAQ